MAVFVCSYLWDLYLVITSALLKTHLKLLELLECVVRLHTTDIIHSYLFYSFFIAVSLCYYHDKKLFGVYRQLHSHKRMGKIIFCYY